MIPPGAPLKRHDDCKVMETCYVRNHCARTSVHILSSRRDKAVQTKNQITAKRLLP
eukprot:gene10191-3161_t